MPAPTDANIGVNVLISQLQRLNKGVGYGLDERGELIGAALRHGFKGKVVHSLVRAGIARQGTLAGRVAAFIVGRENFSVITRGIRGEFRQSTVTNALRLYEQHETRGLDSKLNSEIYKQIKQNLPESLSLRELIGGAGTNNGRIADLHETIRGEIIPNRLAARNAILYGVGAGNSTPAIQSAHQAVLGAAIAIIESGDTSTPNVNRTCGKINVSTGQGSKTRVREQVAAIVADFNGACAQLRSGADSGANAPNGEYVNQRVEQFKQQYLQSLRGRHEQLDAEDGMHVRSDGAESYPIKSPATGEAVPSASGGKPAQEHGTRHLRFGQSESRTFVSRQPPSEGFVAPSPAVDQSHGPSGPESQDAGAPAGDRSRLESNLDTFEDSEELLSQAKHPDDSYELYGFAKALRDIIKHPRSSQEEIARARALLAQPAFANDIDTVCIVLKSISKRARSDPAVTALYRPVAAQMRKVVEAEEARLKEIESNPVTFSEFYSAFEETFADDGPDAVANQASNALFDRRNAVSDALRALAAIETPTKQESSSVPQAAAIVNPGSESEATGVPDEQAAPLPAA